MDVDIEYRYPYRLMTVEGDEVLVPVGKWKVRGVVTHITEVPGCHAPHGSSVMAVRVRPRSWLLRCMFRGRDLAYVGEESINRIVLVRRSFNEGGLIRRA